MVFAKCVVNGKFTARKCKIIELDFEHTTFNDKLDLFGVEKEKLDELKEKEIKKLKVAEIDEYTKNNIEQKSENIANREMKKDEQLFSSYDQYSKIKASNLSLNELKKFENIQADNIDSLNKKLYDFVGADGKYMPFTKSVTIKLNNENLKDIEIIDTPGINDPIASREERTKELLKNCDVIFVVSPSGQFLSSEDIDLLDRITKKEGIQEIYIIASQIDNQLYGSEKEKNRGDLLKVLESIKNTLTKSMKDVTIPILLQNELVSTQTDLNPNDSSFEKYKKVAAIFFFIVFFLLFVWKRKRVFLIISGILLIISIIYLLPNEKGIVKKDSNVYILPTRNSTIFFKLENNQNIEVLDRKNGFIKVLGVDSEFIGWIKEESFGTN